MSLEVADLFATLGLKPDEGAWKKGDQLIAGVKRGLGFIAGYEAVKKITESINSVVELGSNLNDTSQKTGLAVEALQEYGYIAKQNSSSADAFADSVVKLSRGLDEAATKGSGPAADALHRLGLSFSDPAFKNATLDDKITIIAQHLNKFPDGVQKTAVAMDLFGRSGAQLIPTLNQIAEEGADVRAEFREMGGELSGKDAAALDTLGDTIDKAKAQLGALKNQVIIALVPALQGMVEGLLAWVKANREVISSAIHGVVTALMIAFRALGVAVQVVAAGIDFLRDHSELAQTIFIALGAVIGAIAVESAAAWLASMGPIIAVVAVITGLIYVFKDWLRGLLDGKGVTASVLGWIAGKFKALGRGIRDVFESIGSFFAGIAGAVRDAFVAVFEWIEGKIEWILGKLHWIAGKVGGAIDFITGDDGDSPGVAGGGPGAGANAARSVPANAATYQSIDARQQTTINANGVDPQGVVDIAKKEIAKHHDRVWSDADADTGGKDGEP